MEAVGMTPELETLKARLRASWIAGDFGQIAKSSASGAEDFIKRLNLQPGMMVLDVACGTGNLTLPAARMGAMVTGVDIAPNLIEQARENAQREGLRIQFDEGDAEALPYEEARFDAVVTMFGAMFAPRPEVVAAELKFGLAWQIVPDVLLELIQDSDTQKSQRVMKAMMQMKKLDIEVLEKAAAGQ